MEDQCNLLPRTAHASDPPPRHPQRAVLHAATTPRALETPGQGTRSATSAGAGDPDPVPAGFDARHSRCRWRR